MYNTKYCISMPNKSKKCTYDSIIIVLSYCLNYSFHEQPINSVVALIQFLYVFYLLIRGRVRESVYYHLLFICTSISFPLSQFLSSGVANYGLYNYAKLKLFGPLSISFVISLMFLIILFFKNVRLRIRTTTFLIISVCIFLIFIGIFSSTLNIFLGNYVDTQSTIYYLVYLVNLIVYSFLACFVFQSFCLRYQRGIYVLVLSAPLVACLGYIFGVNMIYGTVKVPVVTEAAYFYLIALIAINKELKISKGMLYASGFCWLLCLLSGALGGKGFIMVLLILLALCMIRWRRSIILLILSLIFVIFLYQNIEILYVFDGVQLAIYKLESALILIHLLFFGGDLTLLPESPRIRVLEISMIVDTWSQSQWKALLGSGFGGVFYDNFGYLSGLSLDTAYPMDEVMTNRFSRPHDMIPTVLHLHGMFGLILFFLLAFYFFVRSYTDLRYLVFIPFIVLSFYFNHQFGLIAILFLSFNTLRIQRFNVTHN